MAGLDAGAVFATLGGKFNPAGFHAFGSAMHRARTDMDTAEKNMSQAAARTSASLTAMGRAAKLGAGAGVLGLAAVIGGSVKKAAEFEAQLSSLSSVSSASATQMAQFKKAAMEAGAATKFSALDAAKAQTELAKGGLSVQKILGGGLKGALALAAAGEMDLTEAAVTTVNALKQFGLDGSQATHVADALATAANTTTGDVKDFAMALNQGGGVAKMAGLSFNETVAALEAMADASIKNSDAGTSLKSFLLALSTPSNKSKEAMNELGLSLYTAGGQMKSLPAIAGNLRKSFGDLTQEQFMAKAGTIAGADAVRTLYALYKAGPDAIRGYEQGLQKQGTAAKVAAEKQDNLKGKIENFKGSVETAGIAIGERFLPMLTRGAEKATELLNRLAAEGKIDQFASGLASGAQTAVEVLGDLARVGGDVANVLIDVGQALNLGDATNIEAIIAAIAGFKIAGVIAPMVATLAANIGMLATAPTIGALAGDLLAMVNPFTAVALAAAGLGAGLIILGSKEDAESAAARRNAEAKKAQADAIKSVAAAERAAADKGLASQQAVLDQERAEQRLKDVRQQIRDGDLKGADAKRELAQAELDVKQATLNAISTHEDYADSIAKQNEENRKRVKSAKEHVAESDKELKRLKDIAFVQSRTGNRNDQAEANRKVAAAQRENTRAVQDYVQAVARSQVSDLSRKRLMEASSQITEKNAQGIAELIQHLDGVPAAKQTKLLLSNQNALSQLGTFLGQLRGVPQAVVTRILTNADSARAAVLAFKALLAGVPPRKVAKIVANTTGKKEIDALKAAIASLHGKNITNRVTTIHTTVGDPAKQFGGNRVARGRGPGSSERALVGEGRVAREAVVDPATGMAMLVDGPTIMNLPDTAYVIPQDPRYRGRALGLLADLAKDLGLQGFKGGKKPKKKRARRLVPDRDNFRIQDPVDFKQDIDKLAGLDDEKYTEDNKKKGYKKGQLTAKAREARRELAELRPVYRKTARLARQIKAAEENAANERDAMELADKRDDQGAYDGAHRRRDRSLTTERDKLQEVWDALGKAKRRDTEYGRTIRGRLLKVKGEIEDSKTDALTANDAGETEADRIADTGMTDAERKRLGEIDRDLALAALTKTLDDDKQRAGEKVSFFQGILDQVVSGARPASNEVIAQIAGDLKQARDNLESFSGGGPNDNADVQAELEKERALRFKAEDEARFNAGALSVFSGAGDIGTAPGLKQPSITINTLHPGDPQTLDAIARASVSGMDQQGARRSPRVKVGP